MNRTFREMIKSLTHRDKSPTSPLRPAAQTQHDPVTFEELWNDFDRRTSEYFAYNLSADPSGPRLANWIGSISYSGHTRERCLRRLIENFQSGDENRILLRLTDWVAPIRNIAQDWILTHFQNLPPESIHANQRMLCHLSGKGALHANPALAEIHRQLISRTAAMPSGEFAQFETTLRRIILSASILTGQPLRHLILADKDPANRLLIFTLPADNSLSPEETATLATDKSVRVRKEHFLRELQRNHTLPAGTLTRLALDPSRSLRSIGQFHLHKSHDTDARQLYKTFTDERFYLIADYATEEDTPHFIEGILTGSAKVRTACLRALATCNTPAIAALDLPPLIAANRKQREILATCLPRILSLDKILTLRETFAGASTDGFLTFLRMVERKSFWKFVDLGLVHIITNPEDRISADIRIRIVRKINILTRPSDALRQSITAKIPFIKDKFPRLAENLAFTLKNA